MDDSAASLLNYFDHLSNMGLTVVPLKMQRQLPAMLMKNFSYLVFDPRHGEALVIDPAWELPKLEDALDLHQVLLKTVLVTHGHKDHIDLVKPLVEKYGCEVWMSERDSDFFSFQCDNLKTITTEQPFHTAQMKVVPILTPGHTMGCVCYLIEDNLFSGDTLFIEGCGMCFGKGSDPKSLFHSLQRLKTDVYPATKVFPAHSYGLQPGKELSFLLRYNPYLQFEEEEKFVAYRMREGQTGFFNFQ
ncbi:MAG TPA: MBL fold metallo-hydrolase [Candidatus Angelobacter sp.]|jgi:glyoxylase-like metal-dependent hydrolase (beta-lactamase superfamily II)|nr:MBL fold metallo-hydrolase [Candidatus Angelobacter sp.]